MKRSTTLAAGSMFTAIVASLCCIGPAILTLIGGGAVGIFGSIETYRPYFIALTSVLLALAFYFTYRKKEVVCQDGNCNVVKARRWNKIGVWASGVIVLAAILFPYINLTPSAGAAALSHPGTDHQYARVVLNIKGMDCEACANSLRASLSQMKGVKSVQVNYESDSAVIEYDFVQVTPVAFTNFLARAGYKASVVETSSPAGAKAPAKVTCPSCF